MFSSLSNCFQNVLLPRRRRKSRSLDLHARPQVKSDLPHSPSSPGSVSAAGAPTPPVGSTAPGCTPAAPAVAAAAAGGGALVRSPSCPAQSTPPAAAAVEASPPRGGAGAALAGSCTCSGDTEPSLARHFTFNFSFSSSRTVIKSGRASSRL